MLSVLVAIYNVGNYLNKCIDSILCQSYRDLEIILVDDGSTDTSGKICDSYLTDDRVKVVHQDNRGLVAARKAGLKMAKGEYIAFVDGDDSLLPDMYEKLMHELVESRADMITCGYYEIRDGKVMKSVSQFPCTCIDLADEKQKACFLQEHVFGIGSDYSIPVNVWTKIYKADLIRSAYGKVPDYLKVGEDTINMVNCVKEANSIQLLPNVLYAYNVIDASMSHHFDCESLAEYTELSHEMMIACDYEGSAEYHGVCRNFLFRINQQMMYTIYPESIRYWLSDTRFMYGKDVAIYGAGAVGIDYYKQLCWEKDINITAVYDREPEKTSFPYRRVESADNIQNERFEILLIAVKSEGLATSIKNSLIRKGIPEDKMIWVECMKPFQNH